MLAAPRRSVGRFLVGEWVARLGSDGGSVGNEEVARPCVSGERPRLTTGCGTRTHTLLELDFESSASTIPPSRRGWCVGVLNRECSGVSSENPVRVEICAFPGRPSDGETMGICRASLTLLPTRRRRRSRRGGAPRGGGPCCRGWRCPAGSGGAGRRGRTRAARHRPRGGRARGCAGGG